MPSDDSYPDLDDLEFLEGDCPACEGTGEVCCNCDDHGCSLCIDGMRTCQGCDGSGFMPVDGGFDDE